MLAGLSQAVQFLGDHVRAIDLKERAFAAYRRRGMRVEAAELARWLAFLHGAVHGNLAVARGWMAWAERLLEELEPCAAHGWLTLDHAPFSDDAAERERLALAALSIARRFADRDLEFSALALLGDAYVAGGRVPEGMTLLDETMAAIAGGEVTDIPAMSEIYRRLLSACERAGDVRRAEQWLAAAHRSAAWTDYAPPICRAHYGGILIGVGRWAEAEAELVAALRILANGYRAERVSPLVRLADLRARQGRLEEAERLLEEAEWHPRARRVLAEIALGRSDLELAEDLAQLCVQRTDPSDPSCAPLLALLVDVQLTRGERDAAGRTRDRLAELAAASGDERASAYAALATGRVCEGDEAASLHLQTALEAFAALNLPLEATRAQLAVAVALRPRAPAAAEAEAPVSHWDDSNASAPPATPTGPPSFCAGSERPGAPGPGATGR